MRALFADIGSAIKWVWRRRLQRKRKSRAPSRRPLMVARRNHIEALPRNEQERHWWRMRVEDRARDTRKQTIGMR